MIRKLQYLLFFTAFWSQSAYTQGDNCAAATVLTVNASCTFATYTNATATDSGVANPCANYAGGDVWFSIVVPTSGSVTIDSQADVITDSGMALYSGNCGSLVEISCDDDSGNGFMSTITQTGLTPGETLYIRFWEWGNNNNGTFGICVTEPPPPPSNTDCTGAIELTPGLNCSYVTYTNAQALDSGIADPGCAFYSGGDVWFSIVVPASGEITIDSQAGVITDSGMALYSGTCGSLTLIDCDDDGSANGLMSSIAQTGLTPGETLYVRFWEYGNNNNGTFGICVSTPIPAGTNGVTICEGDPSEAMTTDITCFASGTTSLGNTITGNLDAVNDPSALQPSIFIQSADPCSFDTATANYTAVDFTVSVTGTYVFAMETPVPYFDGMGYIVVNDGSFVPGSCATGTWIAGDDDDGPNLDPEITANLTTGVNYTLYTTKFSFGDTIHTGPFTWNVTTPSVEVEWYTTQTGGTAIGTGAIFDPVGVTDSGLTDTNTAGTTTFWAGCPGSSDPREQADYVINVCIPCKTWNGLVDSDWYNGSNWTPSGIPAITDCVIIPPLPVGSSNPIADILNVGAPVPPAPGPFTAGTLTVENGGFLIVDEDSNLLVNDLLTVENGGLLYIKNNGSIIQNTNVANVGNIYVERSPANGAAVSDQNYVYWSTPVNNFKVDFVSPDAVTGFKWEWNPTIDPNGPTYHGEWIDATGAIMSNAKGYIVGGLSGNPANVTVNHVAPLTGTSTNPVLANSAIFSGTPNNGIITTKIFRGNYDVVGDPGYQGNGPVGTLAYNNDDNWNLIGNPYPSAISADAFIDANASIIGDFDPPPIIGTVWLWPHAGIPSSNVDPFYDDFSFNYDATQYIKHNRTGTTPPPPGSPSDHLIASGQAFFVYADHTNVNLATGSDISFDNSMRSYDYENDNFHSPNPNSNTESNNTTEKHRIWLNLLSTNNSAKTILIGYIENATDANDRMFDGPEFNGFTTNFYSLIGYEKFAIQGKSLPFNDEDTVNIGVVLPSDDIYGISINKVDGLFENEDQYIFLEDTYENVIHNLRESPYKFTSEPGTFNDRFILRYSENTLGTDDVSDLSDITIISNDHGIQISSRNNPIDSVTIYDLLGRVIIDVYDLNTMYHSFENLQLSKGAYIVRAKSYNGRQKIKKVVH